LKQRRGQCGAMVNRHIDWALAQDREA
jgi:hypothetical protein